MSFHRRIWRLVHMCDANANVNANGNASEFTRPTQTQGKIDTQAQKRYFSKMTDNDWAFADSHAWEANRNASLRKLKCFCHLRWRLRLHLHLRWGVSHVQSLAFAFAFSFAEVLLVWLIDRGRCVYWSYYTLRKLIQIFRAGLIP